MTGVEIALSAGITVALSAAAYFFARRAVLKLPADFLESSPEEPNRAKRILRTALGAFLMALGVALLFLPGPGVILIIIGLWTCEFPGRRKLMRKLLGGNKVLPKLNEFRKKHDRPSLQPPPPPSSRDDD